MRRKVLKGEVTRFLEAWFGVRQFIQAANFNRFQGAGLSATQFMTLNLLPAEGDGIAMGELARRMNLKPATVAKTVDSLEARSLVTRMRDEADRRMILVKATANGADLQNAADSHFRAQIEALFRGMEPEERHGLIVGLESVIRAAEAGASGSGANGRDDGQLSRAPRGVPPAKRSSPRSPRG